LLLKRLGKLPCALLFGFKQPHILDCDYGLLGEVFN
jgi:hypothetical protein